MGRWLRQKGIKGLIETFEGKLLTFLKEKRIVFLLERISPLSVSFLCNIVFAEAGAHYFSQCIIQFKYAIQRKLENMKNCHE